MIVAWTTTAIGSSSTSKILPPYLRRSKTIEELIPWLYLRGISTGDFGEALGGLLGEGAAGLSASTVVRLKQAWEEEHRTWSKRELAGKHYVYLWADGIHSNVRLTDERACMLVIMGATADGKKELVAVHDGERESEQSWTEVLVDLKARGLTIAPKLVVADGALGFWKASAKVWPTARGQRCWVHKTANVLNKCPKSMHPKIKASLTEIWNAETREDAEAAMTLFKSSYGAKYPKAVECLLKDREAMLAFYDFPAEHWRHLRTTNPTRIHLRDDPAANQPDQRRRIPSRRPRHGLQARQVGREDLGEAKRPRTPRRRHPRSPVQGRHQGRRVTSPGIPSTALGNTSRPRDERPPSVCLTRRAMRR
ncbi:Transposase, Mutator family [Planctomycetes bacterium Pla86]|uniref:Mutator family transposase n=1 Tax=Engelhardtia mirabilis TaxID=2528011 RepID=A0A518BK98_9BACT|nr:Transposase, Mutator family [Planctomycetes bacterium Pla133]QDV01689.1 Transposase, Mutator family [Planctomycetes bacterium Pla86]